MEEKLTFEEAHIALEVVRKGIYHIVKPVRQSPENHYTTYSHIVIFQVEGSSETMFCFLYETNTEQVSLYLAQNEDVKHFTITALGRELMRVDK